MSDKALAVGVLIGATERPAASALPLTEARRAGQRGIELLQERRTALISAAVTGKIDVRGLAQTGATS